MSQKIDLFNLAAGAILAKLYAEFPNEHDLDHIRIASEVTPFTDDTEKHFEFIQIVESSAHWLHQEGYFRYRESMGTLDGGELPLARLTSKGLAILQATPEVLDPKRSFGDVLVEDLEHGRREGISTTVGFIISKGLELLSGG